MTRILRPLALTAMAATVAFAQGIPSPSPSGQPAASGSKAESSFQGVVMDASCRAITDASRSKTSAPAASKTAKSTASGGSTASTASGAGASGSLSTTTNSGGTGATSTSTSAQTGVNSDQSGQPASQPKDKASEKASASGKGATGSSSVTTYGGSTGTANSPTERSRTVEGAAAGSVEDADVPEQYKDCNVKSSTSSFALLSNGRVYMMDDAEGSIAKKVHIKSPTGWHQVSVTGSMKDDNIQVTTVK